MVDSTVEGGMNSMLLSVYKNILKSIEYLDIEKTATESTSSVVKALKNIRGLLREKDLILSVDSKVTLMFLDQTGARNSNVQPVQNPIGKMILQTSIFPSEELCFSEQFKG